MMMMAPNGKMKGQLENFILKGNMGARITKVTRFSDLVFA